MPIVVGVKFRGVGKVYYFSPNQIEDLTLDDHVIVETARGIEMGQVVQAPHEVPEDKVVGQLKPVMRKASPAELLDAQRYQAKEAEAVALCREQVARAGLPMKVVQAEYNYDGSRLTFFFASEQRVDFRDLVRDLAHQFKTRIELRQIGVRDEARILGGIGKCGRPLCCATWLTDFAPVSIRMAKQQDLPLSPMEISGLCGRLLCCLAYETEMYKEVKSKFPKVGKMIETSVGPARLNRVRVFAETAEVELEDGTRLELTADQVAGKEPIVFEPRAAGLNGLQQRALGQAISSDREADVEEDDAPAEQPPQRPTRRPVEAPADRATASEPRRPERRPYDRPQGGEGARRPEGGPQRREQPPREPRPAGQAQNGRPPQSPEAQATRNEPSRSSSRRRRRSGRGGQRNQGAPTGAQGEGSNAQGSSEGEE